MLPGSESLSYAGGHEGVSRTLVSHQSGDGNGSNRAILHEGNGSGAEFVSCRSGKSVAKEGFERDFWQSGKLESTQHSILARAREPCSPLECGNGARGSVYTKAQGDFFFFLFDFLRALWLILLLYKTVLNEYLIYVKGYDHALKLHDTLLLSKEGKKYAQTMARCIEDTMAQNLPLGAYLILPVQRFPRYKLLLVDLIKHTSKTHPDRAALDAALKEVEAMCAAINNATRNSDAFVELQRLDSMLESGSGIKLTDKPNRMLKADVPIQEQVAEGTKSKWKDRSVLVFDDMLVCVTKKANKPEGWHVEWRALGQAVHLPSSDPNVSSFELVEYKRISEAPYSQCVKHTLKPVDAAHSVSYWIDTMRNFQTLISVPGIMSDAHQWLTSNLITQAEWDVLLRKSGTLSKFNRLSKPVVLEAQQPLNSIYTVVEGEVTEILHVGKHIHLPLRTLTGATDRYFGGGGLLRGSKSPFEVRATSKEVVVASLPYKDLVSILAADPHFHHRFWIYVCVVLTEQFHAWELPKILEKHYLGLRGPRDFAARSELSALFAAASMAPGAQTPAQDLCSLLQLSPVEKIQAAWHHCTLQILQPVRAEIRGTFYVLETCVAVVGHLFGRVQIEMIPFSLISRVGSSGALSIEVLYTRPQMQQSVSAQLVVPPASLSSTGGGKKPIDSMNEALAKFRSSSDSRPAAQGTSASSRFFDPRLELSDKQWDNLFAACAKVHSFKAGEVILEMGKSMSKLYQIVTNRCRVMVEVEVVKGSETTREIQHVNYLDTGSIFGEVMYLYGGSATATIVADNDGTEVYILDRVSLERHLFHAPELAGPFYKAIASSLDDRLQARNERVLRAYSLFLAQKIKAGDIEMEQLLGTTTTTESTSGGVPVIGGVGQPQPPKKEPVRIVRKESIGVIKRPGDI